MQTSKNTRFMAQLSLLIGVQIVLFITPLGYIPIGTLNITTMHLPVLIGAIALGPMAGLALGTVFGITSMINSTIRGTVTSFVFSPFISGDFRSVLIAMIPRMLMGLVAGLLFKAFSKAGVNQHLGAGISAAAGTICNTVFVLGGIYLMFGKMYADALEISYDALMAFFLVIIAKNSLLEILEAVLLCVALVVPLRKIVNKTV